MSDVSHARSESSRPSHITESLAVDAPRRRQGARGPFPRGAALSLIDFEGGDGRAPVQTAGDAIDTRV
jgi:hypothetical protein